MLRRNEGRKHFSGIGEGCRDHLHQGMGTADGNVEEVGDVAEGGAAEAMHLQGNARALRQLEQGCLHRAQFTPVGRLGFRRGQVLGHALGLKIRAAHQVALLARLAAPAVDRQVADDPVEVAQRLIEQPLARYLVEAQPGFLHDVLGMRPRADDARGIVDERAAMLDEKCNCVRAHGACSVPQVPGAQYGNCDLFAIGIPRQDT